MVASQLAVGCAEPLYIPQARAIADTLHFPCIDQVDPRFVADYPVLLWLDDLGLSLQVTGRKAPGPVRAEFVSGKAGYRREHGGGAGQLVAKAVGLQRASKPPHVLDATAGLGQDAYVLAGLGCEVTLLERSPVIHALLADGLVRAAGDPDAGPLVARMYLQAGDSIERLRSQDGTIADVIYLDPMFPHRDKSARVKKEMELFRPIVGSDDDAPELLAIALERAAYRVVVKRPRKAPVVDGPAPSTQLEGKSSRYDIYALRALP
ncbi:class I SAM-dependent methyltransferase [Marinobacter nanhaiticus D15-8W]|uniref:Ribosomal RNA small subunit methyltransferase J n=1 Tax=Marinobacter nanhaiticus D15-8W TaxID=626887 RepID=N6WYL0_9GAMM|nr:class I SAM-dependent methyltransferase [Marinobacter nanhaiticus]ENO16661.1 SAM-dependent methyltransferase [Marinobacter nanhaiticus D15-8W]BES72462.1 class I SAM-dependent methyltransferase [Marinobacter nanhaiticus D15-8W]